MSEILSNTGVKLWSETDYNELWLTIFDQLTGQGGKSNIRLIDEAIGKINVALDGYKFEFSSDEDRLYISKGDSKLPVSLIDSNGHVATKVDGTTITIDESGVIKGVPVDDALSEESTNPLQNKVIAGELKSIKSKMGTDESAIKQNTSDITSNTKRIEANETAISTLNGTGDGSVKKAVSDGIAEVVAGAPEDFDTLKEMSDWISTHETSASAMNSQIQDNKKAITTLQTDKADKTEIPTVPTNVSEFTNDAGYLTEHQDISNLVVKEEGKGLSSNDYTSEEKTKLGGVGTSQGQNLITYPYYRPDSYTTNGITWTVNEDGSITANGTATATAFYCVFKGQLGLEIGKYYVLTLTTVKGKASLYLANENKQNHGTDIAACRDVNDSTLERIFKYSQTDDFDHDVIGLYITTGTTLTNCVIKFQLECGTIRHEYQPTPLSNPTLKKKITDIRSETTVNLLKPTLETITENGVTCTNNGDGTYTLNGTATSTVRFQFGIDDNLIVGKTYKALGIPIAGSYSTILMGWDNHGYFNKDGLIDKKTSEPRPISMQVLSGYTCDNLVFKPMLTTNLSATYDDFVPYTGDTGKLNGDVAELKAEIVNNKTVVDATMSDTSTNPVQNKVIKKYVDDHAPNITVDDSLDQESTNPVQNKVVTDGLFYLKKETTVNLLNPNELGTYGSGITCTLNEDGTYTLNGTATRKFTARIQLIGDIIKNHTNEKLWLTGCPKNGGMDKYRLHLINGQESASDIGSGCFVDMTKVYDNMAQIQIEIQAGVPANNLVFKPMLTTNLNATYDDFVSYTGDTGRLSGDMAAFLNKKPRGYLMQDIFASGGLFLTGDTAGRFGAISNEWDHPYGRVITFKNEKDAKTHCSMWVDIPAHSIGLFHMYSPDGVPVVVKNPLFFYNESDTVSRETISCDITTSVGATVRIEVNPIVIKNV